MLLYCFHPRTQPSDHKVQWEQYNGNEFYCDQSKICFACSHIILFPIKLCTKTNELSQFSSRHSHKLVQFRATRWKHSSRVVGVYCLPPLNVRMPRTLLQTNILRINQKTTNKTNTDKYPTHVHSHFRPQQH